MAVSPQPRGSLSVSATSCATRRLALCILSIICLYFVYPLPYNLESSSKNDTIVSLRSEKNSSQYFIELQSPRNGVNNSNQFQRGHLKRNSIIIFFHIPKSGGSTIINNVKLVNHVDLIEKAGISWESSMTRINHFCSAPLPPSGRKTLFVHLHIHAPPFLDMLSELQMWRERAESNHINFFVFTILREPVSWAISLFNMWLRSKGGGNITQTTEEDLRHVAQHNPQCSYLTHKFAHDDSTEASQRWRPQKEDCDLLLDAMRDQVDWTGRTERLEETTNLLSFLLDLPADFEFHKFNSAAESAQRSSVEPLTLSALSNETIEYHRNISTFDYQLLEAASREWKVHNISS